MPNYWVADKSQPTASWIITFRWLGHESICPLVKFVERIVRAGEQDAAYRIIQSEGIDPYRSSSHYSYAEYVADRLERTRKLYVFDKLWAAGDPTDEGSKTRSLLAFYDLNEQIVEEEIENMGLLLERLRPQDKDHTTNTLWTPPIQIWGLSILVDQLDPGTQLSLSIDLHTDIWFPRVMGFLELLRKMDDPSVSVEDAVWTPSGPAEMYDNRALAQRHTPRLNRFLHEVRQAAIELGATWELDEEGCFKPYASMRRIDGIDINS